MYKKKEVDIYDQHKTLLTPVKIRTYAGENTIFLVWDKPKSPRYRGVRIFRSTKEEVNDQTSIEEELYDGSGGMHALRCTYRVVAEQSTSSQNRVADDAPPPRKRKPGEREPPPAPTGLRAFVETDITDNNSSYYADISVSPSMSYTYKVWAYDDENRYGYPIIINASLNDVPSEHSCFQKYPVNQQNPAK